MSGQAQRIRGIPEMDQPFAQCNNLFFKLLTRCEQFADISMKMCCIVSNVYLSYFGYSMFNAYISPKR